MYNNGDRIFHIPTNSFGTVYNNGDDPGLGWGEDPDRIQVTWDINSSLQWIRSGATVAADDPIALGYIASAQQRDEQLNRFD